MIELPEPAAWREDDGHWIYYDETNSPSTAQHIHAHQKDAHEESVFALFTADQMRAYAERAVLREARVVQLLVMAGYVTTDQVLKAREAAIRNP